MNPQELQEYWLRESSIQHIGKELALLGQNFEKLSENSFIINVVILGPKNTLQCEATIAEWSLTGDGSPNPSDKNYTQSARILQAGISAIKQEMIIVRAEMITENRELLQKS